MLYYIAPILFFIAFLLERGNFRKLYKFFLWFSILFVSFIACFRGNGIGTDYFQYEGFFEMGWVPSIEPIYNIINYVVKTLTGSFQLFLSVIFLLSYSLRFFAFKKLSLSLSLSLMLISGFWFLVYDMNGIRQALSLSFTVVSLYFAYKKEKILFYLFLLLAIFSHYSSIVFLPFYYLINIKMQRTAMFLLIAFTFIFSMLGVSEVLFSLIMKYGSGVISSKSSAYSNIEGYNQNAIFSFGVFHRILIFIITLLSVPKMPCDNRLKQIFLVSALINLLVFLLLSRYTLIATRGSLSYKFVECIFFSYLPFIYKDKLRQNIIAFFIFLYVILQIYITLSGSSSNDIDTTLVPYKTIFG